MTVDLAWAAHRWSGAPRQNHHIHAPSPPPSISNSCTSAGPSPAMNAYLRDGSGEAGAVEDHQRRHSLPPLTDNYTDPSAYHLGLRARDTPPSISSRDPHLLPKFPSNVSPWSTLAYEHGPEGSERHGAAAPAAPLTLHIPKDHDLPRIPSMFATAPSYGSHGARNYNDNPQSATCLPSFASIQQHANRADDLDDSDANAMSARAACHLCSKLQSLVREVAVAVGDLDENVQLLCNKPNSRPFDVPRDNPVHAVQWILERLRFGSADLQAVLRVTQQPGSAFQPTPTSLADLAPRNLSPSNTLKRPAERWDHDDIPSGKRPHVDCSPSELYHVSSVSSRDDRRPSLQYHSREQPRNPGVSPQSSESVPESAYAKPQSPLLPSRPLRTLPSPTSITYPPSAAPSLAQHTGQSIGSPETSTAPDPSIVTASSDSATSAHIADLQHQVTLKSLTLQTLRTEYASLLQKVQRLNVKTQTIERKSNVADQEVNELTNKNEDLTQQLQSLQEQLDDSEKRREQDREKSSREKDQWLQMLEQGRRLQVNVEADRKSLTQRIATLQAECERLRQEHGPNLAVHHHESDDHAPSLGESPGNVMALRARIRLLQSALDDVKLRSFALSERAHHVLDANTDLRGSIVRALRDVERHEPLETLEGDMMESTIAEETSHPAEGTRPGATTSMPQPALSGETVGLSPALVPGWGSQEPRADDSASHTNTSRPVTSNNAPPQTSRYNALDQPDTSPSSLHTSSTDTADESNAAAYANANPAPGAWSRGGVEVRSQLEPRSPGTTISTHGASPFISPDDRRGSAHDDRPRSSPTAPTAGNSSMPPPPRPST